MSRSNGLPVEFFPGVVLFPARPFHGNHRGLETQAGEKSLSALAPGTQHPRDIRVVAHDVLDQCAANPCTPMLVIDHHHRQVAVGQAIGDPASETDDALTLDGDGGALRVLDQLGEVFS